MLEKHIPILPGVGAREHNQGINCWKGEGNGK